MREHRRQHRPAATKGQRPTRQGETAAGAREAGSQAGQLTAAPPAQRRRAGTPTDEARQQPPDDQHEGRGNAQRPGADRPPGRPGDKRRQHRQRRRAETSQNDPFAAAPGNGAPGRLKYSARSTPGHPRRADGASNNRQRQQKRQQQGELLTAEAGGRGGSTDGRRRGGNDRPAKRAHTAPRLPTAFCLRRALCRQTGGAALTAIRQSQSRALHKARMGGLPPTRTRARTSFSSGQVFAWCAVYHAPP